MQRREGAFFQALTPPSHFWLSLLPFYFKHFLLASSSYQVGKKMQRREGVFPQAFTMPSHFWLLLRPFTFAFLFQMFSRSIFFFSCRKKNAKKGGSLLSSSCFAFSFFASIFGLMFLPFRFKRFFLGIFFFSSKKKEIKTQRKKKKKKGKELTYFQAFILPSHFWPHVFVLSFQGLSPWHFHLLKQKKRKEKP